MDEQRYLINGRIFAAHDPGLQEALARVHGTPARPRCLCIAEGVEMYVSKFSDFVIKRMPETGGEHRPTCPSYELPANESGLGEVLGEAIIERGQEGVELRLDFPLTRRVGRSFAAASPQSPAEVTVVRKALSLRGLLHYLWERAGFNRWYPRMQGKRSYWVLRKFLLHASEEVETKGLRLAERVFIPENFSREQAAEIAQTPTKRLSILLSPDRRSALQDDDRHRRAEGFQGNDLGLRGAFSSTCLIALSFSIARRASAQNGRLRPNCWRGPRARSG